MLLPQKFFAATAGRGCSRSRPRSTSATETFRGCDVGATFVVSVHPSQQAPQLAETGSGAGAGSGSGLTGGRLDYGTAPERRRDVRLIIVNLGCKGSGALVASLVEPSPASCGASSARSSICDIAACSTWRMMEQSAPRGSQIPGDYQIET